MDDDIAGIDQHPVSGGQTLDPRCAIAGILEFADQAVADRSDMTVGAA